MRILRIIYDWPPPWQGLAPAPYEMTRSQTKLGHKVDVFCGRWPSAGPIEELPNVALHPFFREPLPGTLNLTTSVVLFFYYLFWRRKNKVDLIHSHGHFAIWIYLYRFLLSKVFPWANELKIPIIAHFHNTVAGREDALLDKGMTIKSHSKFLAWPLAKFSDQLAVQIASACIFVSEDTRKQAIQYYQAEPSKCFVVESAVNTSLFRPTGAEELEKTRRDLNIDQYDKVILNVGVMLERKNIHLLIEAMSYLPDNYKLLLVGPGDPKYLLRLEELISQKHLAKKIVRVGVTPYPQTPIAYQASDIFVLPSSFEGLPKVAMESLSCGVPILVSGFKFQDTIEGVYYLEKLDAKHIAENIKKIIENPQKVNLAKIHSFYSWDERAKQVEKVYEFARAASTKA